LPFHNNAFKAAEAVDCAGQQGKFWQMHNEVFKNQNALNPENLSKYAGAVGVDMPKFKACLDSGKYSDKIKKDIADGQKAGVTGTPTTFIGWVQPDGKTIKAVKKVVGAQPYAVIKGDIDNLLGSKKEK